MADEEEVTLPPEEAEVTVSLSDEKEPVKEEKQEPEADEREIALSELRQQLDAARQQAAHAQQAKQQAEQYAKQQAERAYTAQSEASENQYRTIINAINASEQAAENAERALADALAAGDYAQVGKIQSHIARIQSQLTQFESAKGELEERAQYQRAEGRVPEPVPQYQPQPQVPQDPVAVLASQLSPKSATWLRSHPELVNHVPKLKAAHEYAVNIKGIKVESPEYFSFIEQELGVGGKAAQPKKPAASTPVTSSASYSSTRGGNTSMVLSAAEVEQAILNEPDLPRQKALEAYARNKQALIKEGRL